MNTKGFTTLELLIVIAMIGILLSVVLASFIGARTTVDTRRGIASLQNLQAALEEYKAQCRTYPIDLDPMTRNSATSINGCTIRVREVITGIDTTHITYISMRSGTSVNTNLCEGYHAGVVIDENSKLLLTDRDWAPGTSDWVPCDPSVSFGMPPSSYDVTSPGVVDTGTYDNTGEPQ